MSDNKYKMFRNYMCNELGITKEDIEQWTKEAVAERVEKIVSGYAVESHIDNAFSKSISSYEFKKDIKNLVAEKISDKINISL